MIQAIHQSMLSMALRCGEQFRRRYMEGEIIPPNIAAARGTGVHTANKINLRQKIQTGRDLPVGDILDACRDGYVRALRGGVYLTREDAQKKHALLNEGLSDALRCARVYRDQVAPSIIPVSVEEPFLVDIGLPLPLGGTMDHEQGDRIDDLKTSSAKWPAGRAEREIQPVFYSLVHEREMGVRPAFRYHVMIARRGKGGNATSVDLQTIDTRATEPKYVALMHKLGLFIKMIERGVFIPADPSSWACSPEWCGYYHTCPAVGNGKQLAWV